MKHRRTIFHSRVGPVRFPKKECRDMLCRACVFASSRICGSRSAFRCIQGTKCRRTTFQALVGPVQIPQNTCQDTLAELVFLQPVGSMGHVVHSALEVRNIDAQFFIVGWARCSFFQKCTRTSYSELMFLDLTGSAGHLVHSGASRTKNNATIYFILGWPRHGLHKKHAKTGYAELVFVASGGISGSRSAFR
jgi:hypothetical protein